jgi:hypothetical protein
MLKDSELDGSLCRECGKQLTRADQKTAEYVPDYGYLCGRCVSANSGRRKLAFLMVAALVAVFVFSALGQTWGLW